MPQFHVEVVSERRETFLVTADDPAQAEDTYANGLLIKTEVQTPTINDVTPAADLLGS